MHYRWLVMQSMVFLLCRYIVCICLYCFGLCVFLLVVITIIPPYLSWLFMSL